MGKKITKQTPNPCLTDHVPGKEAGAGMHPQPAGTKAMQDMVTVRWQKMVNFSNQLAQLIYRRTARQQKPFSQQDLQEAIETALEKWLFLSDESRSAESVLAEEAVVGRAADSPTLVKSLEEFEFYKSQMRLLSEIGTGLWRLRQKMVSPETGQPLDEMRRAYRHFESIWDAMHEAGVVIQDHTHTPYDPHLALKVLTYEPTPGITHEQVLETIKPSIYFNRRCIQMGEIIVATTLEQGSADGDESQKLDL